LGNTVYMVAIGLTAFSRNLQLRKTRESLRQSERTLTNRLSEIQDLQARLQEQASRDPLTGLYNRRFLDTIAGREIARCHRDHQYMVVMLIDIDHFKNVNDTDGHQAGDEVLKTLSALLLEKARAADVPCRYGGEEFILLLPGMAADIAMVRANQWRNGFADKVTLFGATSIKATISIGVAVYPSHGETLVALTRSADLALYRAKAEGRNRVVMYEPEMDAPNP
jgi:diguanylate cyclase (GGDEF)-like protein